PTAFITCGQQNFTQLFSCKNKTDRGGGPSASLWTEQHLGWKVVGVCVCVGVGGCVCVCVCVWVLVCVCVCVCVFFLSPLTVISTPNGSWSLGEGSSHKRYKSLTGYRKRSV